MLKHAIIAKKYSFVELLLKEKINLNSQDIYSWTALMYASKSNHVKTFTQLLSAGCDPFIKDKSGKSVITHIKEEKENSVMINALVNHQFDDGRNILMEAVIKKDIQSISELLTVVDVNSTDKTGRTAFFYATAAGEEKIAQMLISAGADLSIQDKSHKTARQYAVEKNQETIVALIDWSLAVSTILKGVSDSDQLLSGGKTFLMIASKRNDISSSRLLLDSKVDIDETDEQGRTALFYAAAAGHKSAVELLLSEGADPAIKDKSGKNARMHAEKNNHHSVTSLIDSWLAKKNVQPGSPDDNKSISGGITPLMIASKESNISDIKKLLNAKVDVHAKDEKGRTALFYAAAAGHEEVANLLLGAGASPLIKDKSNKTPVDYADTNKKYVMMYRLWDAELDFQRTKPVSSILSP